ncbi:hypothetical protein MFIFM68171_02626 [Madurella fahalii]|uniref:Uncharacterized protein n=1 Tax=Madurella fahalii TaxID=1157608 RepID=A0ABQ0G3V6_9PEZI
MASREAAKRLIQDIWNENTANGTINCTDSGPGKIIGEALKILSDQLYDQPTHFLMELIQNADDNTYQCQNPSLSFTYKKGSLRVDCNEVGFSERNVRAICRIGESTKAGHGHSSRYIGEKGIGFKSVFKVASIVYISSGHFSFKFDRSEKIGPIAPTWAEFPGPVLPGHTSFFLQLSDDCNEEDIVQDMERLGATLLMFLRQLGQITLTTMGHDGKARTRKIRRKKLQRNGSLEIMLHDGESVSRYFVVKRRVTKLPDDEKRMGCSESEVLLSFPVLDCDQEPRAEAQSVYAFLPIKSYGFKFLLQGDFLLTANREDIIDCPWNHALRDACAEAFMDAVKLFNTGPMKYTWPYFIPTSGISSFFVPLQTAILSRLETSDILESLGDGLGTPSLLVSVPKSGFTYNGDTPFTVSSQTISKYLSPSYPDWATKAVTSIGVKELDDEQFLADLNWILTNEWSRFAQQNKTWHSQLAEVLVRVSSNDKHKERLLDMALIPLRDGQWVSPRGRSIFFGRGTKDLYIPESVPVYIIDPEAESDPRRKLLFTLLGARSCDAAEVCRLISDMHNDDSFNPEAVPREELLAHVMFMFRSSFTPPATADLWFATESDGRCKGSSLYMHGDFGPTSVERTLSMELAREFHFIHSDYEKALAAEGGAWVAWLQTNFRIATTPRIQSANMDAGGKYHLSNEFRYLFQNCPSPDVLTLLRDHWAQYSEWLEDPKQGSVSRAAGAAKSKAAIKGEIMSMTVETLQGAAQLATTVLPGLDQEVDKCVHARVLGLPDPENLLWSILGIFGVAVRRDVQYYLQYLKALQLQRPLKESVAHAYRQIHAEYSGNERVIRSVHHVDPAVIRMPCPFD